MVHQYFIATGSGGWLQWASPSGAGISHGSKKKQVLRQKIFWAQVNFGNSVLETDLKETATGGHNRFSGCEAEGGRIYREQNQSSARFSEGLAMPSFSISS
jgi:hypothetical protein